MTGRPAGKRRDGQRGKPQRKQGGPKRGQQDRPQANFSAKSREPDPDSPFAVLAGLKLKQ